MRLAGVRMMVVFTTILIGITIAPAPARAAGGTISGTVVAQFGQPAVDAEVLVDGAVVTTTDGDGAFRTPPLAAGTRQVQARLAGFGPSALREVVVSDDTDQWTFLALGYPLVNISGTVTDADGVPFEGAEIAVDGVVVGLSGPSGAFSIADVEGGNRRLTASAAGYSQPREDFVFLTGDATDIALSVGWRDGPLSGTVTDAAGVPITGATVLLDDVAIATSGANGSFTTGVIGGGFRWLTAIADGYTSAGPSGVLVSGATSGVIVSAGDAAGTISGIVQDSAGQRVAGAEILVDEASVAISAADGSFTTTPVPGGGRQVRAVAPGFGNGWPSFVRVSGDVTGAVVVVGPRNGTITGIVLDQLDQSVVGATVYVDGVPVATSGPDGAFTTDVVAGGFRSVSASGPGTFPGWTVNVSVDGDVGGVQLQVGRAAAFVTGVVTDPDGTPLSGIQYRANWWGGSGVTGDDGVFALTLEPGEYQLAFTDQSGRFRQRTFDVEPFAPGTTVRDVTLQPRIENVIGTVTDASGNPVAGAMVVVNGLSTSPPTTVTDGDGRFALTEVPPWPSYWITVTPPAGSGLVRYTQPLAVVDPDEVIELDITMNAAARIEIEVTADGGPAAARAVLLDADQPFGLPVASGFADESGRIVLADLQPGRYVIGLDSQMPGFADEFFPDSWYFGNARVIDVAAGDVVELDADLERSAVITGVVIGPDGDPDPGAGAIVQAKGSRPDLGREVGFACNEIGEDDPPGTYRKGCLHPSAQYIVWVGEGFDSAAQYYDGAATPDDATPVAVVEGGTTSGIDFRLEAVAPPVELLGLSRQFFRAGTTTTGVRLYGDNFPLDPNVLVAEVQRASFDDVVVDIDVTAVLSDRIAVVTVTVGDGAPTLGSRRLEVGRVGSAARALCDTCLYVGSPEVEVGAMSGRVTTATGAPLPFAQVVVTGRDRVQRRITAGPDGRWTATGLAPGEYRATFLGTTLWAGEHWRNTTRVWEARPVTVTANRVRRGLDATLSRRPAISITSVSPATVPAFGSTPVVLRGTGLAPIEGGFTVSYETSALWYPFGGANRERTGSSLWIVPSLPGGTYDVVVRWTDRRGVVNERRCDDCLTVRSPFDL